VYTSNGPSPSATWTLITIGFGLAFLPETRLGTFMEKEEFAGEESVGMPWILRTVVERDMNSKSLL
jgi:hypothetical protein